MKTDREASHQKFIGRVMITVVGLLGIVMVALRGMFGGQSVDDAGLVAAGVAGFFAVAHLLLTLCVPLTFSMRHAIALLLVLLAPVGFLFPTFARPEQGWPVNPGNGPREVGARHSRVIAPGDAIDHSWSPKGIESVGALWRGLPKVEVVNADEVGCLKSLAATGRSDKWESMIWTRGSLSKCPPTLCAKFRIPDDAELAGKSLKLRTIVSFAYPAPHGKHSFVDRNATVSRSDEIVIASSAVKKAYWSSWYAGVTVGLGGTALGGLMLVWLAYGLRESSRARSGYTPPLTMSEKAQLIQSGYPS